VQPFGPALGGLHFPFVYPDSPQSALKCAALGTWLAGSFALLSWPPAISVGRARGDA
jgi:hypothetical protein